MLNSHASTLVLLLALIKAAAAAYGSNGCIERESTVLLAFKSSIIDTKSRPSSWEGKNRLSSTAPRWLWNATKLTVQFLGHNSFQEAMPDALESMTFLYFLAQEDNKFAGHVSETIFTKLCNLNILRLDYSNFSGNVSDIMDGIRCSWSIIDPFSRCKFYWGSYS